MKTAGTALGNRLTTMGLVALSVVSFRFGWPEADARAEAEYTFVLTLGYGHLIGAAIVRRSRVHRRGPRRVTAPIWWSFCGLSIVSLFAAYFAVLDLFPASEFLLFASPLLTLSVWHTLENDLAIERAYARGYALGPIPREAHIRAVGLTAVMLAAALVLPRLGVTFADVFAVSTLYHLFQWLVFLKDRIVAGGDPVRRGALVRGIAWAHLPAAILCGAIVVWRSSLPPLAHEVVFSPSLYLFWSSLHVLQTAMARGSTWQGTALEASA